MDSPVVFEFAVPIAGTYPPWYDPTYWYAGVTPHFSFEGQWPVFFGYFKYWLVLLLTTPGIVVTLAWNLRSSGAALSAVQRIGWLVTLPLIASGMFCLVVVDKRHVAVFLAVIAMALWGVAYYGIRRPKRIVVLVAAWISAAAVVAFPTALGSMVMLLDVVRGAERQHNPAWTISQGMTQAGLRPGDRIGYIGCSVNAYWARLSGAKIVADLNYLTELNDDLPRTLRVNASEIDKFWAADEGTQARVLDAFTKAGASFAVADHIPANARLEGWVRADEQTYVRKL